MDTFLMSNQTLPCGIKELISFLRGELPLERLNAIEKFFENHPECQDVLEGIENILDKKGMKLHGDFDLILRTIEKSNLQECKAFAMHIKEEDDYEVNALLDVINHKLATDFRDYPSELQLPLYVAKELERIKLELRHELQEEINKIKEMIEIKGAEECKEHINFEDQTWSDLLDDLPSMSNYSKQAKLTAVLAAYTQKLSEWIKFSTSSMLGEKRTYGT